LTEQTHRIVNEFIPWTPWQDRASASKVALITTGGVFLKKGLHQPFGTEGADSSFREFPSVAEEGDLDIASCAQYGTFARQDINVLFPLKRLHELAEGGYIGAVAPFAYSFLGVAAEPLSLLSNYAPSVAYRLKRMGANLALVVAADPADHQAAALVARTVELAGISTVLLGTNRAQLEAARAPRSVVVDHPAGAPLGNPGNAGKHQHLLRELLDAAWLLEAPGMVAELPFSWKGQ